MSRRTHATAEQADNEIMQNEVSRMKDESPSGQGGGFQKTLQSTNVAIVTPPENSGKPFANLRAKCALAGIALSAIENDHGKTVYIVSKWALIRLPL